jgi:hypothetical protein
MMAYNMESIEKINIAAPRLMRSKEKGAKVKARKILGRHQSRKKSKTTALKIRTEKVKKGEFVAQTCHPI